MSRCPSWLLTFWGPERPGAIDPEYRVDGLERFRLLCGVLGVVRTGKDAVRHGGVTLRPKKRRQARRPDATAFVKPPQERLSEPGRFDPPPAPP